MTISQGQESVPRARAADKPGTGSGMGGGLVPGQFPPPESMRPTLVGERWAVVAGHPLVSQVAAEVLGAGGNAVDAGVAAGLASNVVQVDMANFGGIAPILVRPATSLGSAQEVFSVAGVGRWGAAADLDAVLAVHHGTLPLGGVPSIVPGAPAAWTAALQEFGTWSFADVVAPAVELARRGFPLDLRTARSLEIAAGGFARWPSSARVYTRDGDPLRPGDRLVQAELGDLLATLAEAEHGASRDAALDAVRAAFYEGGVASTICEFVQSHGGSLTTSDLADFRAEVAGAPSVAFGDWQVFSTPGWSQGPVLLETLALLAGYDLPALAQNGLEHLHLLTELIGLAFADRERYLCDPDFMSVTLEQLLDPGRLAELRGLVGERALAREAPLGVAVPGLGSTTSVVVSDAAGNAFATSPSDTLDGAPIIPGLGILCSPRGVQSRLVAEHPNALRPGQRPCVTPTAAIAVRGPEDAPDVWALACPGGDVIVQAIAQVFCNVEAFGQTLQEAVEAPRIAAFNQPSAFHPHPVGDNVVFAEGLVDHEVRAGLEERGHAVTTWPDVEFDAGSVQTTMLSSAPDGGRVLQAGADHRRSAYGIVR